MSSAAIPAPAPLPRARFGRHEFAVGSPELGVLRDANALLDDADALRVRLAEDGYLLIRGLHDRDLALETRRQMLGRLAEMGRIDLAAPLMDARIPADQQGTYIPGVDALTGAPAFQELVRSPRLMRFFSRLLDGPATTYDFQWLRVIGNGGATGAHYDAVYMGRGTPNVFTCWTPLGDLTYDMGPLAICVGSHREPGFEPVRRTYGRMDVDRDRIDGWFSNDPVEITTRFGGRWATSEFRAGDALIFGMLTMHASLVNVSDRFRLTSDTRYQLASEPADERWIGERPKGHYNWHGGPTISMEDKRREWGV